MHRKNYKKKIMDGVQHMVSYNLTYEGKEFEFKTEVIKRKSNKHNVLLEIPYSLKESDSCCPYMEKALQTTDHKPLILFAKIQTKTKQPTTQNKKIHLTQKTIAKNAARAIAVVMIHFQSIGLRKSGFNAKYSRP